MTPENTQHEINELKKAVFALHEVVSELRIHAKQSLFLQEAIVGALTNIDPRLKKVFQRVRDHALEGQPEPIDLHILAIRQAVAEWAKLK